MANKMLHSTYVNIMGLSSLSGFGHADCSIIVVYFTIKLQIFCLIFCSCLFNYLV
jgi:hypothetical protein